MKGEDAQRIRQATGAHDAGRIVAWATLRAETGAGPGGDGGSGDAGPDVVDADFEEVDKRDRKTG